MMVIISALSSVYRAQKRSVTSYEAEGWQRRCVYVTHSDFSVRIGMAVCSGMTNSKLQVKSNISPCIDSHVDLIVHAAYLLTHKNLVCFSGDHGLLFLEISLYSALVDYKFPAVTLNCLP